MSFRRGRRHRWFVLLLVTMAALGVAAPAAKAAPVVVTGGDSRLVPNWTTVYHLLFIHKLSTVPVAPAGFGAAPDGQSLAIVFPISGGLVESSTMLGTVNHAGGLEIRDLYNQVAPLKTTELKIVNGNTLVGNAFELIPAPTADLVNATSSVDSSGTITYSADVNLSSATASVLNLYFNRQEAFKPGMNLGRLVSTIRTQGLLPL